LIARNRERNRDLAVVLLAGFAAVLTRYTDRVLPFFGMPVSSMIQARTGAAFSMTGSTKPRTDAISFASSHGALATK
jgi:hypothetical protein